MNYNRLFLLFLPVGKIFITILHNFYEFINNSKKLTKRISPLVKECDKSHYHYKLLLTLLVLRALSHVIINTTTKLSKNVKTVKYSTPYALFHWLLIILIVLLGLGKIFLCIYQHDDINKRITNIRNNKIQNNTSNDKINKGGKKSLLKWKFLIVFWTLRCGEWLQGPYLYDVYASTKVYTTIYSNENKSIAKTQLSVQTISKILLLGYASTAIFGPYVGRICDKYGRKKGILGYALFYIIGACSVQSNYLHILFLGRFINGIGSSLVACIPESWLISEVFKENNNIDNCSKYLSEIFGLAYQGDSIVAISAGQLATLAANTRSNECSSSSINNYDYNPKKPFELSVLFFMIGSVLTILLWNENVASSSSKVVENKAIKHNDNHKLSSSSSPNIKEGQIDDEKDDSITNDTMSTTANNNKMKNNKSLTIQEVIFNIILTNPKILLIGLVQVFFESAMYIFIVQWAPALSNAIIQVFSDKDEEKQENDVVVPFGTVFSCFMTCCLLGSNIFIAKQQQQKRFELSSSANSQKTSISSEKKNGNTTSNKNTAVILKTEYFMYSMLLCATFSMALVVVSQYLIISVHSDKHNTSTATAWESLILLIIGFFLFEVCVGIYFPSMGTIRSQIIPESYRSIIMNLFGVPLNILIVIVFLFMDTILGGIIGTFIISTICLSISTYSMKQLIQISAVR